MNIQAAADVPFKRPTGGVARHSMVQYPAILAAVVAQPVFHFKRLPGIKRINVNLETAIEIFRMHVLRPAVSLFLLQATSDEVQPALVEVVAKLVSSRHPYHHR